MKYLLLAVLGWGLTWPINKLILAEMSPYWLATIRSGLGAVLLVALALPGGRLALPTRADMPVLLSITLLHMVGFTLLVMIGLQLVPVGRSVVVAYTTPLWVMPAAALFLGERLTARRIAGVVLGLAGLAALFNPLAFDWSDRASLAGHGALLVASLLWAASMVHNRGHRWRSTPFQLVPWETLLATAVLLLAALLADAAFPVNWSLRLGLLMVATSVVGIVVPYWAIAVAGRDLPAITVALGMLATPIVAMVIAALWLGEAIEAVVWIAALCVMAGVLLGTRPSAGRSG